MTQFRCPAEDDCPLAQKGKIITIRAGEMALCPHCASELVPATEAGDHPWQRHPVPWAVGAAAGILLAVFALVAWEPPAPPPALETAAAVPAPLDMAQVRLLIKAAFDQIAAGKLDIAKVQLEALLRTNPQEPLAHYNLAVIALRQSQPSVALARLKDCFESGFDRFDLMDQDKDLDPLRKDPDFMALVNKHRKPVRT